MDTSNQSSCPQCGLNLEHTLKLKKSNDELLFCPRCLLPQVVIAGKYRLEGKLDEGGNGVIYLARHMDLELAPLRVVKFLKQDAFTNKNALQRFRREIQVTASISDVNQHIVRIFDDFGEVQGLGPYYIMEYLEGLTLDDLLFQGELPIQDVLHIFKQLCLAVQTAHQNGILHRDLKPSNLILVERNDDPYFLKVMDFGLAKTYNRDTAVITAEGTAVGTPLYMPPEQLMGQPCDHRADIYAMGLLLYEMLTGKSPFESYINEDHSFSFVELAQAHLSELPPKPSQRCPGREFHPMLDTITLHCIAKDPNDRYDNIESILQNILDVEFEMGLLQNSPLQLKREQLRQNQRKWADSWRNVPHSPSHIPLKEPPNSFGENTPLPNMFQGSPIRLRAETPLPETLHEPPEIPVLNYDDFRTTKAFENPPGVSILIEEQTSPLSPHDTLNSLPPQTSRRRVWKPETIDGTLIRQKGNGVEVRSEAILVAKGLHAIAKQEKKSNLQVQKEINDPQRKTKVHAAISSGLKEQEGELSLPEEEEVLTWESLPSPIEMEATHSDWDNHPIRKTHSPQRLFVFSVLAFGLLGGLLWQNVFSEEPIPTERPLVTTHSSLHATEPSSPVVREPSQQPSNSGKANPPTPARALGNPPPSPERETVTPEPRKLSLPKTNRVVRKRKAPQVRHHAKRKRNRSRRPLRRKPSVLAPNRNQPPTVQTPGCPRDTHNSKWIRFRIVPGKARVSFSLPYRKTGTWYCVEQPKHPAQFRVRIRLSGYYPCLLRRSYAQRDIILHLRREPKDVLTSDPPLSYCLQSKP